MKTENAIEQSRERKERFDETGVLLDQLRNNLDNQPSQDRVNQLVREINGLLSETGVDAEPIGSASVATTEEIDALQQIVEDLKVALDREGSTLTTSNNFLEGSFSEFNRQINALNKEAEAKAEETEAMRQTSRDIKDQSEQALASSTGLVPAFDEKVDKIKKDLAGVDANNYTVASIKTGEQALLSDVKQLASIAQDPKHRVRLGELLRIFQDHPASGKKYDMQSDTNQIRESSLDNQFAAFADESAVAKALDEKVAQTRQDIKEAVDFWGNLGGVFKDKYDDYEAKTAEINRRKDIGNALGEQSDTLKADLLKLENLISGDFETKLDLSNIDIGTPAAVLEFYTSPEVQQSMHKMQEGAMIVDGLQIIWKDLKALESLQQQFNEVREQFVANDFDITAVDAFFENKPQVWAADAAFLTRRFQQLEDKVPTTTLNLFERVKDSQLSAPEDVIVAQELQNLLADSTQHLNTPEVPEQTTITETIRQLEEGLSKIEAQQNAYEADLQLKANTYAPNDVWSSLNLNTATEIVNVERHPEILEDIDRIKAESRQYENLQLTPNEFIAELRQMPDDWDFRYYNGEWPIFEKLRIQSTSTAISKNENAEKIEALEAETTAAFSVTLDQMLSESSDALRSYFSDALIRYVDVTIPGGQPTLEDLKAVNTYGVIEAYLEDLQAELEVLDDSEILNSMLETTLNMSRMNPRYANKRPEFISAYSAIWNMGPEALRELIQLRESSGNDAVLSQLRLQLGATHKLEVSYLEAIHDSALEDELWEILEDGDFRDGLSEYIENFYDTAFSNGPSSLISQVKNSDRSWIQSHIIEVGMSLTNAISQFDSLESLILDPPEIDCLTNLCSANDINALKYFDPGVFTQVSELNTFFDENFGTELLPAALARQFDYYVRFANSFQAELSVSGRDLDARQLRNHDSPGVSKLAEYLYSRKIAEGYDDYTANMFVELVFGQAQKQTDEPTFVFAVNFADQIIKGMTIPYAAAYASYRDDGMSDAEAKALALEQEKVALSERETSDVRKKCKEGNLVQSGDLSGSVCVVNQHTYLNEFHESALRFNNLPGGAYQEVYKCLCSTSSLEGGTHSLSVQVTGSKGSRLVDPEAWLSLRAASQAPGASSATSIADFNMLKADFKTDNPIFTSQDPTPHFLLISRDAKMPVASIQIKVYNAKAGEEGSTDSQQLVDDFENFSSAGGNINVGGTAVWVGTIAHSYETEGNHVQTTKLPFGLDLRIPKIASWPWGPNADGSCDANHDFNSFKSAQQACNNHPILGVAISSRPKEMASSYNLSLMVRGTPSDSH